MNNQIDLSQIPYEELMKEVKRRKEVEFYTRINTINEMIKDFLEMGCPVIDVDNPDYRITKVGYCVENDEIYFYTEEIKK